MSEIEEMIARRSKKTMGMVNFPVNSLDYENTKEGGMFVELWVVEKIRESCGVCIGYGNISTIMSESLIGTDTEINKDNLGKKLEEFVFLNDGELPDQKFPLEEKLFDKKTYESIPLIACITMGSTGWSGWNKNQEEYWRCHYDNLDSNGKNIYDSLQISYPKSDLILVTWLDT